MLDLKKKYKKTRIKNTNIWCRKQQVSFHGAKGRECKKKIKLKRWKGEGRDGQAKMCVNMKEQEFKRMS